MYKTSFFKVLLLLLGFGLAGFSHASECNSYYGNYAIAEEKAAAQALLRELHFDGYMRDFIGWFYTHDKVKSLTGKQKAILWREAVQEVQKKQKSYHSREVSIEEGDVKATAFVGSIASNDFKSTIVFFESPKDGEFAFLYSTQEMVSLAEQGVNGQGLVKNLSAEDLAKLKTSILKAAGK